MVALLDLNTVVVECCTAYGVQQFLVRSLFVEAAFECHLLHDDIVTGLYVWQNHYEVDEQRNNGNCSPDGASGAVLA